MGSEWERKRAEGFKKRLDKGLLELGTPDLFTRHPQQAPRIVAADIADGAPVQEGQDLVIQKIGGRFALMCGLREVGQLLNPHAEIADAVEGSFGVARAIIQVFHKDASVAEIVVC